MESNNVVLSSTAFLCDKDRIIQKKGIRGILSLTEAQIRFQTDSGETIFDLPIQSIQEADLTNIKSKWQIILKDVNKSYILALYEMESNSFLKGILRSFLPSFLRASFIINWQTIGMENASKWKQALLNTLPLEQIKQRNELRLGRTILVGVLIPVVFCILFITILRIIL